MSHLTFADLINRSVPLAAHEAAALTLAVARLLDAQRAAGQPVQLPDDEWILLSSSGDVSLVEVHGAVDGDETARLSGLLRRLLHLDERHTLAHRERLPGGLLIVLARNLGYIHLPATGPVTFRSALERFAAPEPVVLAAVFWRAARGRPELLGREAVLPTESRRPRRNDRRRHSLPPAELRRTIRDLERELYQTRRSRASRAIAIRQPVLRRHTAAAATVAVAISFTGMLALAVLALTGGTRAQAPATGEMRDRAAAAHTVLAARPVERAVIVPVRNADVPASSGYRTVRRAPAPGVHAPAPRAAAGRRPRRNLAETSVRPTRDVPKRANPLATLSGGTRGIPFAMPPG